MTAIETNPSSVAGRSLDWGWVLATSCVLLLFASLAAAHVVAWAASPNFRGAGFVVLESLVVILFLFRRRAVQTTTSARAWLAASGTYIPLLLQPEGITVGGLGVVWGGLQFVGVILAVASLLSLGRSFGIVAANRGVQTHGLYRVMRHPIYASYTVTHIGYLLENLSAWSVLIVVLTTSFQVWRIIEEERVLSADPTYRQYQQQVPYRLVPFVY